MNKPGWYRMPWTNTTHIIDDKNRSICGAAKSDSWVRWTEKKSKMSMCSKKVFKCKKCIIALEKENE